MSSENTYNSQSYSFNKHDHVPGTVLSAGDKSLCNNVESVIYGRVRKHEQINKLVG